MGNLVFIDKVPGRDLAALGDVCMSLPRAALPYIAGALERYCWPQAYARDDPLAETTQRQMRDLIAALTIADECLPAQQQESGHGEVRSENYVVCEQHNGELCMACYTCLRWNNGVLEQYACGEWSPVPGELPDSADIPSAVSDVTESTPIDDAGYEENINCRLAYAAALSIEKLHLSVVDAVKDNPLRPDRWLGDIRSRMPEYDIDTLSMVSAFTALVATVAAGLTGDLIDTSDDDFVQFLANSIQTGFSDDDYNISRTERAAVTFLLVAAPFERTQGFGPETILEGEYWSLLWQALEGESLEQISLTARSLPASEINCDELPLSQLYLINPPAGTDWIVEYDLRNGAGHWNVLEDVAVLGVGVKGSTDYFGSGSRLNMQVDGVNNYESGATGVILAAAVEMTVRGGDAAEKDGMVFRINGVDQTLLSASQILSGTHSASLNVPYTDLNTGNSFLKLDVARQNTVDNRSHVIHKLQLFGSGDVPLANAPVTLL